VGGDSDGLEEALKRIPGIAHINTNVDGNIEFETIPGQDQRPEVAKTIVSAGYDMLEMRPVGVSLENVFLQLTRDEPSHPESPEDEPIEDEEGVE
jgi:ABC-2 type transport system ATP-binding protein